MIAGTDNSLEMRIKCSKCGEYTELADPARGGTCRGCGRMLIPPTQPRVRRRPSETTQKRAASISPGMELIARVVRHPGLTYALHVAETRSLHEFALAPRSGVTKLHLLNKTTTFRVTEIRRLPRGRRVLVVRPTGLKDVTVTSAPPAIPAPEARYRSRFDSFEGTELGRLVRSGRRGQAVNRIQALAFRKDDPAAWEELALGFSDGTIREPIKQALQNVGCEKVIRLMNLHPDGAWDPALPAFLDNCLKRQRPHGPSTRKSIPFEDQAWER